MKRVFLALVAVSLSGCVWSPTNRTEQDNSQSISVWGYAPVGASTVVLSARNRSTGQLVQIGSAQSSSTASETGTYSLYYFGTTITPAADFWSPQTVTVNGVPKQLNGLAGSVGRLEFTASVNGSDPFGTFSAGAKTCWSTHYNNGESAVDSGIACYDGQSTVVFDNDGVNQIAAAAQSTDWNVLHSIPEIVTGVTFEFGRYWSQSKWIYGYVCRPSDQLKHKAVIINHGGVGPVGIDGNTAWGWCIPAAQAGWYAAMSAYRGEYAFWDNGWYKSDGEVELCEGEVADVLRLTDIVRVRPEVDNTKILMWGYSHGGCVTERAVQQGALVKAAASLAGPTDFHKMYDYCDAACDAALPAPGTLAMLRSTFGIPSQGFTVTPTQAPIAYDWRSSANYKDDLKARTDVKFLAIHGAADVLVHPSQGCSFASGVTGSGAFYAWHMLTGTNPPPTTTTAPTDCATSGLSWQSGSPPYGSWPASRYLLVYEGEDHLSVVDPTRAPWLAFVDWVNKIFP